jgi:hypothetical protein
VTIPYARFEGRDLQWSQGGDAERQWLDLVLHEGADREVDLAALNDAVVGFVLAVGDPAPASATVRDGVLTVASGDLTASGAVKPAAACSSTSTPARSPGAGDSEQAIGISLRG